MGGVNTGGYRRGGPSNDLGCVDTIADLDALEGYRGAFVKCMDPRFGYTGAIYHWNDDLNKFTRGPIRRGNRASWAPCTLATGQNSSSTNQARQLIFRAPSGFSRVRVSFANQTSAPTTPIGIVNLAVSTNGDSFQPSVGGAVTGDESTGWIQATAAFPTIPANRGSLVGFGWASTPWTEIKSIPASDGGRPWLFIRYGVIAAGHAFEFSTAGANEIDGSMFKLRTTADTGQTLLGASSSTGGATFDAAADANFAQIMRVDFASDTDFESIDLVGASTIARQEVGADKFRVFYRYANAQSLNISLIGYGVHGSQTSDYYTDAVGRAIADSYSRYIVWPVFNGTDSPAHAPGTVQKIMRRAMSVRAQAKEAGKEVAFLILNHNASQDGGVNQAARNSAIAELYASGAPILDARSVIGQTANPNLWIPEYTMDGTHFSNAGRDVAAAWFPKAIAEMVSRDALY